MQAWDGNSPSTTNTDRDQTTTYTYDGNDDTLTMTAVQPSGGSTPNQTTAYIYGVGGAVGTSLFSNDLIAQTRYPDKSTGTASTVAANDQNFGYDFLGEKTSLTDQNGTTHDYLYDVLGRLTADYIPTNGFGAGVDSGIARLGYSYDTGGRPYQQTSYFDNGGTYIANQVQDAYNGYGQLTTEYQEHAGAVNTGTSKKIQYSYSQPSGANYSRLTSMTYPNGRVIDYLYGGTVPIISITFSGTTATATTAAPHGFSTGQTVTIQGASQTGSPTSIYDGTFTITVTDATHFTYTLSGTPASNASGTDMIVTGAPSATAATLDGVISRVSGLKDDASGTILEAYSYLGPSAIVQKTRPEPGSGLTYIQQTSSIGDAGDRYTGLDRFGRVIDQYWTNTNTPSSPSDRLQYGYDQDSNVLYRKNSVNTNFSELYHANGSSNGYDALNRIKNFQRGTLNSSNDSISTLNNVSGVPNTNNWNLDAVGNHLSTATQTNNTFNAQNQITGMAGFTTPTYDNNGNMTTDEAGNTYTYDAWNRLVWSYLSGGPFSSQYYSYDANNRRPGLSICSGAVTDSYYTSQWQDIQDDVVGGSNPGTSTYVWSLSYIDDLVARDTNAAGPARIYAQQDANHDVTSLVNVSGSVLQRYIYDPYGTATILNAGMTAVVPDGYFWVYTFQGGRYDPITGKINFRHRDLDTTTGTWMEKDLAAYINGPNLYQFELSGPTDYIDPMGLYGEVHTTYIRQAATQPTTQPGDSVLPVRLQGLTGDPTSATNIKTTGVWKRGDASYTSDWNIVWGGNKKGDVATTTKNITRLNADLKGKSCLTAATLYGELQHVMNYTMAKEAIEALYENKYGADWRDKHLFDESQALNKYMQTIGKYTELDAHNAGIAALQEAIKNGRLGKCGCTETVRELQDQLDTWTRQRDDLTKAINGKPMPTVEGSVTP